MKTLEIDGIKVRVQIWWVILYIIFVAFTVSRRASRVIVSRWRVFVLFAGTRRVRNDIRPSPNSTTGGHRWGPLHMSNRWSPVTFMCSCGTHSLTVLCSLGHHLCVRHHMQVVLSAPGQVGERCRRSKTTSSLVSLSWTCCPSQRASVLSHYLSVGCLRSPRTRWPSVSDKMMKFLISVSVVVVLQCAPDVVQRILVGNKCDEELTRQVTTDQGSKVWLNLILWFWFVIIEFVSAFLHLTWSLTDHVLCGILWTYKMIQSS